jgi:ribosomal protein S18 acetylase RimI-like enzyme
MSRDLIEYGHGWRWTARRVLRSMRDPATNVAVARDHDRLIGFAIAQYLDDEAHLVLFAVDVAHRRRGVGSALLAWHETSAQTAGIGVIYLEARIRNTAARAFYRRHGFIETETLRGYYSGTEDAVRIAKDLW